MFCLGDTFVMERLDHFCAAGAGDAILVVQSEMFAGMHDMTIT